MCFFVDVFKLNALSDSFRVGKGLNRQNMLKILGMENKAFNSLWDTLEISVTQIRQLHCDHCNS